MDYGNAKTASMRHSLGGATLPQLAFPWEGNPNFLWEESHWVNTVKTVLLHITVKMQWATNTIDCIPLLQHAGTNTLMAIRNAILGDFRLFWVFLPQATHLNLSLLNFHASVISSMVNWPHKLGGPSFPLCSWYFGYKLSISITHSLHYTVTVTCTPKVCTCK